MLFVGPFCRPTRRRFGLRLLWRRSRRWWRVLGRCRSCRLHALRLSGRRGGMRWHCALRRWGCVLRLRNRAHRLIRLWSRVLGRGPRLRGLYMRSSRPRHGNTFLGMVRWMIVLRRRDLVARSIWLRNWTIGRIFTGGSRQRCGVRAHRLGSPLRLLLGRVARGNLGRRPDVVVRG